MNDNLKYLKEIITQAGLPPQAVGLLKQQLTRAGYDVTNEKDAVWGTQAFLSMVLLSSKFDHQSAAAVSSHRKIGRNDPCPCGSKKKYKKCCLTKTASGPAKPILRAEDVIGNDHLIPKHPNSPEASSDLRRLESLFKKDEKLSRIRFTGHKIFEFMDRTVKKEGRDPKETFNDPEFLHALSERYFAEVEPLSKLGDLEEALLDAAPRCASLDDLRALGTGLTLHATCAPGETTPLVRLVFRQSFQEYADSTNKMQEVFDKFGGVDELQARIKENKQLPLTEMAAACEVLGLDPGKLQDEYIDMMMRLDKRIRTRDFPIGLPYVTMLPLLAEITLLGNSKEPTADEIKMCIKKTANSFTDEDLALIRNDINVWLEGNADDTESETYRDVMTLLQCLNDDKLVSLRVSMIVGAIDHLQLSFSNGMPEPPDAATAQEALSLEHIEEVVEYLEKQNLPQIAQRTRELRDRIAVKTA